MTKNNVSKMRKEYTRAELDESTVHPDPFVQFRAWFDAALKADFEEPNAMTLSTVASSGKPSSRMVLLKSYDEQGFVFFTNYNSQKGQELAQNPRAALLFWWDKMDRQIQVEGEVEKISEQESSEYFNSRPRGSQLGAWVSNQSAVIAGREVLVNRIEQLSKEYEGREIPRPPYWGGYRVKPLVFEFWQGRPNRLHDRLQYRKLADGSWIIERLSP
jgi:pyridoxamine 5'-phosphate oxidase